MAQIFKFKKMPTSTTVPATPAATGIGGGTATGAGGTPGRFSTNFYRVSAYGRKQKVVFCLRQKAESYFLLKAESRAVIFWLSEAGQPAFCPFTLYCCVGVLIFITTILFLPQFPVT